jgi:hypothetical protein
LWHPKSAASDHFKTNMTKVTPKVRLGSQPRPQNKNIIVFIQDFPNLSQPFIG